MSIIDFTTRRPVEDAIIEAQAEYSQMGRDVASDKQRTAYDIFMGRVGETEYRRNTLVGVDLTDRHCFLCEGTFARVGFVYGFWHGPDFVYVHSGCRNESENWSK